MPNIRIFIRAVSSAGELSQERPVRLNSRLERHYNVALGI